MSDSSIGGVLYRRDLGAIRGETAALLFSIVRRAGRNALELRRLYGLLPAAPISAARTVIAVRPSPKSIRRVKIRISPAIRMRAAFVIPRLLQVGFPRGPGRKLLGLVVFDLAKATVFVGVGHWLHDTPPIFQTG
jgi:hypothetical protein